MKKKKFYTLEEVDKMMNYTPEQWVRINAYSDHYSTLIKLRQTRKESGLTQEQLSKKSGIPRATISKIEIGDRNPTILTLAKIAGAMDKKLVVDFV